MARVGRDKPSSDVVDTTANPNTIIRGAKLSTITQSLAYKTIKALRGKVLRKATDENIAAVQLVIKEHYNHSPSAAAIWKSIRRKDITRQIRTFMWRCMHGSLRIGKYWRNIPECEEREICQTCGETESLEHIMLQCARPGQAQIWKLAEELWRKKGHNWPNMSLAGILGCGLARFTNENKRPSPGDARFFLILVTESAHLIWKLRCECVVGRDSTEPASENEVHNRWIFAMNERLEIDRNLIDKSKYGKQYSIAPSLVLETWRGVLENEEIQPEDWLRGPEVLVGIAPHRSHRSPSQVVGRKGRNR
jgi:ribonuclease HI